MPTPFSSAGFDLDALPGSGSREDVVLEVGGSATIEPAVDDESPISRCEQLKLEGNEAFKNNNYLEACDMYTSAIECCPGISGVEILAMKEDFEAKERGKQIERNRLEMIERGKKGHPTSLNEQQGSSEDVPPSLRPEVFKAPTHEYGHNLAIYHCNRAACMMHLENYEDSVKDCDIAILLRPEWGKAFVRRSAAYEKLGQTEIALVRHQELLRTALYLR